MGQRPLREIFLFSKDTSVPRSALAAIRRITGRIRLSPPYRFNLPLSQGHPHSTLSPCCHSSFAKAMEDMLADSWADRAESALPMRFHLVSYATAKYRHRQIFLAASARANRVVATETSWNPQKLIAAGFPEIAPDISLTERGSGFWAWKPFIILRALEAAEEGETILYCDAGRKYPYILLDTPLDPFVSWMKMSGQDIMPGISIPWNGAMSVWTKHDAFAGTGVDDAAIRAAAPIQASFSLWRNTKTTKSFVKEWLSWCVRRDLVSDDLSTETESPDFKAHRHDQSLLNLCCLKHGIKGIDIGLAEPAYNERDPSQILKNVFGSDPHMTPTGKAIALTAKPIQIIEQTLRERITFGKIYK